MWLPRQRIGSGVLYEEHHYILTHGATAECRDLKMGALIFSERLKGPGAKVRNWSSLVRSGDNLYTLNQGGDVVVFRAAPKFELLATNSIGEKMIASMAVLDGRFSTAVTGTCGASGNEQRGRQNVPFTPIVQREP